MVVVEVFAIVVLVIYVIVVPVVAAAAAAAVVVAVVVVVTHDTPDRVVCRSLWFDVDAPGGALKTRYQFD